MKKLLALLSLLLSTLAYADPAPRPMPWVEISRHFYSPIQVRMWGPDTLADPQPWTAVYIRSHVSDPYPSPELQPGVWYDANVAALGIGCEPGTSPCNPESSGWIGADVLFVSGVGIITGGTSTEPAIPDMHVTFAQPNDPVTNSPCVKYLGQFSLPDALPNQGTREDFSTIIPMINSKFKFCYTASTTGNWPTHPGYGLNLTAQWWGIRKLQP